MSPGSVAPYRLRKILYDYDIRQAELCARLVYQRGHREGQPLGDTTVSTLLTRRVWPVTLSRESIESAVAQLLRERAVPDAVIKTAWEIDGHVDPQATPSKHSPTPVQNANPHADESPFAPPETEMLSPAARQHFNFARDPFIDDVQGPQDVYISRDQRYVRESMYYAAKHSGFLAVVGESGSGKSTLRRELLDRIRRDNEPIVVIQPKTMDKKVLTAAHICDAIIADLSNEVPKQSLEAKGRQILRILTTSGRTGNTHALVIEEAHDLSVPTLKYLKRFWELEDGFKKLLGIILIGQPELGERLDERRNYEAREVIRRCEMARLKPLNGNLEEYLALKFKRIGVDLDSVFERDAFDAIRARLTRRTQNSAEVESYLYPLVVHNLITKCANEAVDLGLPKIGATLIGRV